MEQIPFKSLRSGEFLAAKLRRSVKHGEAPFEIEPGDRYLKVTFNEPYEQVPRVRYVVRMLEGFDLTVTHNLGNIEVDHFLIAVRNQNDQNVPVKGIIYWDSFIISDAV